MCDSIPQTFPGDEHDEFWLVSHWNIPVIKKIKLDILQSSQVHYRYVYHKSQWITISVIVDNFR